MADDVATPWYMNLGTWINIVQGILGLLVAAGGAGIGIEHAHAADATGISTGLSVTGLSVVHQVRSIRLGAGPILPPKRKVGDM